MIGPAQGQFQTGHIRQVGEVGQWRKTFEKGGHRGPIVHHQRRPRRVRPGEQPRELVETLRSQQLVQHRKCAAQRFDQGDGHVVAIDVKSLDRRAPVAVAQARRCRGLGIEQGGPELGLQASHMRLA